MNNLQNIIYAGKLARKHGLNVNKLSKKQLQLELERIAWIIEFYANAMIAEKENDWNA